MEARFGDFALDLASLDLHRGDQPVELQHQPRKVLAYLVRNPGRVIPRAELQEHLWGDRYVDAEQGLNNAIRQIRRALGDRAESPTFLETVPRQGYRFIAPVEILELTEPGEPAEPAAARPERRSTAWWWQAAVLAGLLLIGLGITAPWRMSRSAQGLEDPEAWAAFVEARFRLAAGDLEGLEAARGEFRRVTVLAPDHAPAWLGLAEATWLLRRQGPALGDEARTLADKALELDPLSGRAHLLRAEIGIYHDWDREVAAEHYAKALALAGGLYETHKSYGFFLAILGKFPEAVAEAERSLELDPISASAHGYAGRIYFLSRRYRQAALVCQRALELTPRSTESMHWCVLDACLALGSQEEARTFAQAWLLEMGGREELLRDMQAAPSAEAALQRFSSEMLREIEAAGETLPPGWKALAAARAGEWDRALHWLEVGHQQRSRSFLYWAGSPMMEPLQDDPRYQALLADSPLAGVGHIP